MSMYRQAISMAMPEARARMGLPSSGNRVLPLVKVSHVIPTPHGPVIAGELVIGEYFAPGEVNTVSGESMPENALIFGDIGAIDEWGNEIGWSLKGALKKVGKGIKAVGKGAVKVTKVAAKVVKAPVKLVAKTAFKGVKLAAKGGKGLIKANVKILKKTGKVVLKGSKAGVKFAAKAVKKLPVKALALAAIAPAGLGLYAAYKGAKFVAKTAGKALGGGGGQPEALGPVEEEGVSEESPTEETPESYPGEEQPTDESAEEESPPDVLDAPEADEEYAADESEASEADSEEQGAYDESDTGEQYEASDESEDGSVEGESNMSNGEEWVGLEEIAGEEIGDENDYNVGAAPRRRPQGGQPGPNAVKVKNSGYTKYRRQYLPVNSTGTIAAAATATITIAPQTLFRGRRLSVPTSIAPSFIIEDLKVGNVSQGAAAGAVPAEAFVSNATGEDNIQMDTASPGKTISMTVTNISGGALAFRAALFGDSVQ